MSYCSEIGEMVGICGRGEKRGGRLIIVFRRLGLRVWLCARFSWCKVFMEVIGGRERESHDLVEINREIKNIIFF